MLPWTPSQTTRTEIPASGSEVWESQRKMQNVVPLLPEVMTRTVPSYIERDKRREKTGHQVLRKHLRGKKTLKRQASEMAPPSKPG